jgi:radical SAM superfamily enzyme YgiQ (UPF0313 family)
MARICLINPRFQTSFWGLNHGLPLLGKKSNMPVLALPVLAGLTPPEHEVVLVDENVEEIDFDALERFDIVGLTGMTVQRDRMREILEELRARGIFTVVGGPWVTVVEEWFAGLFDVLFVGEAEETWPRFLAERARGGGARRYEQSGKTDMTRVPAPRFDLLKMRHYAFGSVQFSRGCPFQCEFCDIIVVFGRKPRLKTAAQIIAELEALRVERVSIAFIVDDNLIGNKRAAKELLRAVIAWQRTNGFPLTFVTEASLDLADDEELMRLMTEANIAAVFVGIESANEESLRETRKLQNLRRGGTMVDKVRRIQDSGMEVWAGMILGFDSDDAGVFAAQRRFLAEARISTAMVGMLSAIPKTPLYERLEAAGRLDHADAPEAGTNILPLQMDRATLRDGYTRLMAELYDSEAYFDRLDALYLGGGITTERGWLGYAAQHPWRRRRRQARLALEAVGLAARLLWRVPERGLRRTYRQRLWRAWRRRADPAVLRVYAIKCAMHYHVHRMVAALQRRDGGLINTF